MDCLLNALRWKMKENEELRSGKEEGMLALGASWRGGPDGSHSSTRRFSFTFWHRYNEETSVDPSQSLGRQFWFVLKTPTLYRSHSRALLKSNYLEPRDPAFYVKEPSITSHGERFILSKWDAFVGKHDRRHKNVICTYIHPITMTLTFSPNTKNWIHSDSKSIL